MVESMERISARVSCLCAGANSSTHREQTHRSVLSHFYLRTPDSWFFPRIQTMRVWQPQVLFSGCSALGDR